MVVNQLRNSGPNRVMLDIARHIDKKNFKVVIVAMMQDDTIRPIATEFEKSGIEIHRFSYTKLDLELKSRSIGKYLGTFVKTQFENPILQAHGYHPLIIVPFAGIPFTTTIHCIASQDFISSKGHLLGNYMVWRFKKNLTKYEYPVAISSFMKDYYHKNCGDKIRLIHNGVNFSPRDTDISFLKKELNLPSNKSIIIIPGGLRSRKNNAHTICQLKELKRRDFICVFLGLGPDSDHMVSLIGKDERFRLDGYTPRVRDYLSCADLYISSSKSEGLPLAALEAICMGVPSLLSNIPPHMEIASTLNMPGVKTFSILDNSLMASVSEYLDSDFNKINISRNAIEFFSAETMAKNYEKLLEEIYLNSY